MQVHFTVESFTMSADVIDSTQRVMIGAGHRCNCPSALQLEMSSTRYGVEKGL